MGTRLALKWGTKEGQEIVTKLPLRRGTMEYQGIGPRKVQG